MGYDLPTWTDEQMIALVGQKLKEGVDAADILEQLKLFKYKHGQPIPSDWKKLCEWLASQKRVEDMAKEIAERLVTIQALWDLAKPLAQEKE